MNTKDIEKLQKQIFKKDKLVFDELGKEEKNSIFKFAEDYKDFLNNAKTERQAVKEIIKRVEKNGFMDIKEALKNPLKHKTQKYYSVFKEKTVALAVIGKQDIEKGTNIIVSHIDSPRLDLKQNPVYEDTDMALLKTHYYGGIKKYQWLSIPLALYGTVIKANGEKIDIKIGDKKNDPIFVVSDLLPHLAGKTQTNKKVSEAFEAEKLNLIAGSIPLGNDKIKNRFKLGILKILYDKYGITEEDFTSAEFEAVPAIKAKDIGFDRSMIGAYGQDDRICAFAELKAFLKITNSYKTAVGFFFDKEEIGSEGNSGAKSKFLESFFSDIISLNSKSFNEKILRDSIMNSMALSADVNAAIDPNFKDVYEKMNGAKLGHGICITKFTGARGKSGASDASAEFVGMIRKLFNENNIVWQTGELGKVDQGGGGTIAKYFAEYGMDILDCGPGILSMHSPFEISSKADVYMTYKGYLSFIKFR